MPSNYPVRNGGWLHKLESAPVYIQGVTREKPVPAAPMEVRDRVYRDFLSLLSLSSEHRNELSVNRGLPENVIKYFRSVPRAERPWSICKRLIDRGHSLEGIPGFYRAENRRGGCYWTFSMKPGFIIPILDTDGRIQALQTRLDIPDSRGKYRLFSSSKKKAGSCSGVPVHVAKPNKLTDRRIWITEGPLKATIASQYLGAVVLGLIGATTWKPVLEVIEKYRKAEIVIAFDMDQTQNVWIARAVRELINELVSRGCKVMKAVWAGAKGVDDALLAKKKLAQKKIVIINERGKDTGYRRYQKSERYRKAINNYPSKTDKRKRRRSI
ncbi:hypothetical protein JOC37_001289 [Desulfohalotomaculum tongense]|nr:hypothetical protein [Desulforadius tongensis]